MKKLLLIIPLLILLAGCTATFDGGSKSELKLGAGGTYPTSLPTYTNVNASSPLTGHASDHNALHTDVTALATKIGTGTSNASSATNGDLLTADGSGGSSWTAASGVAGNWATSSSDFWFTQQTYVVTESDPVWVAASSNYLLTSDFATQFANSYNATTTLNGFTPANYLLTADFATNWATQYNATTTLNGFTPTNYLLTSDFNSTFNTAVNSSSTIAWGLCANGEILKSNGTGYVCAADDTGVGGTGSNWLFGADQTFIEPSTTVGLIVSTSSTITSLVVSDSLTGAGFDTAFDNRLAATTTFPAFQSLWDTAFDATTTAPWFIALFNNAYNATTTQTNFLENWNALYNATTTFAGFQNQFDTVLIATTTWTSFDTNWDRMFIATTTWTGFQNLYDIAHIATSTTPNDWIVGGNATTTGNSVTGVDGSAGTTTISIQTDGTSGSCFEFVDVEGTLERMYFNGTTQIIEAGGCK